MPIKKTGKPNHNHNKTENTAIKEGFTKVIVNKIDVSTVKKKIGGKW